jgi:hypothetical protein
MSAIGTKRTFDFDAPMSASDPQRTSRRYGELGKCEWSRHTSGEFPSISGPKVASGQHLLHKITTGGTKPCVTAFDVETRRWGTECGSASKHLKTVTR